MFFIGNSMRRPFPKVILSGANISHYHYTAYSLQQAGYLYKYLCVFSGQDDLKYLKPLLPERLQNKLDSKMVAKIDNDRISTYPLPYLITQALGKLHLMPASLQNHCFSKWYDQWTSHEINSADIFHFVNSAGLESAGIAKIKNMKLICDVRAAHIDAEDEILRKEYQRLGLPYQSARSRYRGRIVREYSMADALIVPSQYVAQTMKDHGVKPEKIHVIPYGVNVDQINKAKNQTSSIIGEMELFRVIFVGSVIPRKGLHYLIKAWESLNFPNSELVIIGRCPEKPYLELLKKLITRTKIRFIDHLPQIKLAGYYQSADLFVLPSLSEGSALVVYEAMSAGLPILTTSNAGSVVRDGKDGFVIPPADVDALEEKLLWYYEHPLERKEMGNYGQNTVTNYSWEEYGKRLIKVYDKIIENNLDKK